MISFYGSALFEETEEEKLLLTVILVALCRQLNCLNIERGLEWSSQKGAHHFLSLLQQKLPYKDYKSHQVLNNFCPIPSQL